MRRSRRLRALLQFVEVLGARKESAKNRRILKCICMRYLVRARVKPGREKDLLNAIEEYFDLTRVQDAHDRGKCRDNNGSEPWACGGCDCTARLEQKLANTGKPFLQFLREIAVRWKS